MSRKKKFIKEVDTKGYLEFFKRRMRDMNEVIALHHSKPNYRDTIKTMIKNSMRIRMEEEKCKKHDKQTDLDMIEYFKISPVYQKRRTDALMEYLPILSEKFKASYSDISLERIVLDMCECPTTALPDSMFIDKGRLSSRCLTLAIALYILDELYRNETIWEALLYLPNDKEMIDTIELPDRGFTDAIFPDDVIKSMVYLVENRDGEDTAFLNAASAQRTKGTVSPIEHTQAHITREQYQSDNCIEIDKILKQAAEMTCRERMDKIFSLMSPIIIERAETRFTNKLFDLFDITFTVCHDSSCEIKNSLESIISTLESLLKLEKRMDAVKKKIDVANPLHNPKPNCLMIQKPIDTSNSMLDTVSEISKFNLSDQNAAWKLAEDWSNQYATLQVEQNHANNVTKNYYNSIHLIENGHNHDFRYENNKTICEQMNKLTIENPYELLFAYFYLLDRGSNIVWLIEPAAALIDLATVRLPWASMRNQKLNRYIDEFLSSNPEVSHMSDKDYSKEEEKLYQLNYTDYIDWHVCGMEQTNNEDLQKINFAQLIYQLSNVIIPRNMNVYDDNMYRGFARTGVAKKNIPLIRLFIETNDWLSKKKQFCLPEIKSPDISENDQLDVDELQNTISEKTKQITQLKSSLYNAEKKVKEEQGRAEKIAENAALEHEELIELRELIYKIQNDSDDNDVTVEENTITLPYVSKQNIVVFGGHATWLKAVKPLLPKVRFIEPTTNPDINMIRNADVVWMQSNAMPHSYYNKIMDIVRLRKIPVKYFAYASAEKCARQLAEDDIQLNANML